MAVLDEITDREDIKNVVSAKQMENLAHNSPDLKTLRERLLKNVKMNTEVASTKSKAKKKTIFDERTFLTHNFVTDVSCNKENISNLRGVPVSSQVWKLLSCSHCQELGPFADLASDLLFTLV